MVRHGLLTVSQVFREVVLARWWTRPPFAKGIQKTRVQDTLWYYLGWDSSHSPWTPNGTKTIYRLWKTGGCLWTLCKTIIGFSPEFIPNVATADDTGNSIRVSVSPWEKTNKTVLVLAELGQPQLQPKASWGTSLYSDDEELCLAIASKNLGFSQSRFFPLTSPSSPQSGT